MKKLLSLIVSAIMLFGAAFSVGCGGGNSSSDQTLEIFLLYKGYQDEWLKSTVELFKKEPWVKEKYPNLNIPEIYSDDSDALPFQKLSQGVSMNPYDLFFGANLDSYGGSGIIADLTDKVYLAEVPGESGVRVKDKIPNDILEGAADAGAPDRPDGENTYYSVNYVSGLYSLLYNADLLEALGREVPLTSYQFLDTCAYIKKTGYDFTVNKVSQKVYTSIMNASEDNYWQSSFVTWWAQYEGVEEYRNFYRGIFNEDRSNRVLEQKGRLRALEEIESIFQNDYGYESANAVDYIVSQTNFLSGNGVFHYNGDYIASEMALTMTALKKQGIDYDIRFMKMPVLSSVVEKLELYTSGKEYNELTAAEKKVYDDKLAAIIKEIDDDVLYDDSQAKKDGVSRGDYEKVAEARCIAGYASSSAQTAVVPEYSPAKELAFDFLRFMYTDKAIANFAVSSGGVTFPSTYNYKENPEIYGSFNPIQKSKMKIKDGTDNYPFIILPGASTFPLGKAGLDALVSFKGKFEVMFALHSSTRQTANDIYQADINYWNDTTWGQLLARAGYSA